MFSPDASGLVAQMRSLADLAQPLLAVTDQLLGDVWMCGKHWILLNLCMVVCWVWKWTAGAQQHARWLGGRQPATSREGGRQAVQDPKPPARAATSSVIVVILNIGHLLRSWVSGH